MVRRTQKTAPRSLRRELLAIVFVYALALAASVVLGLGCAEERQASIEKIGKSRR